VTDAPPANEEEEQEDVPVELKLELPSFAGPMDLLVELVRKHEIDIFDIPIARITEEYLACIDRMETLDLEVGGEWLEMAARLIYIKSRTLLPDEDDDEEEEGPDPREELVRRIVAYERFKKYAEKLAERPTLGGEVFTNAGRMAEFRSQTGPPDVQDADLDHLIGAVQRLIDDSEEGDDFVYEMTREKLSMRSVILEVANLLEESPRMTFQSLFADLPPSRNRIVTTFLALLEMSRLNMISLFQSKIGEVDDLYVERAVVDILEVSQSLDLPEDPEEAGEEPASI
jgi:segregation and condensation protein A